MVPCFPPALSVRILSIRAEGWITHHMNVEIDPGQGAGMLDAAIFVFFAHPLLRSIPLQKHRLLSSDTFLDLCFTSEASFVYRLTVPLRSLAFRRSDRMRTCYGCCGTYLYFFFLFCIYATIGEF